ncbi:YfcC family protein [Fusobacterium sp.]|uniref:YfcC family protein n=2 Tax=Fusobacterium sp. TaxID=68766 RepID=UPI00262A9B51|nr:TIGR00366 family protein [Fusobacterium sp.]
MQEQRRRFTMPHTYVLIGMMLVIVTILTYLVPAGVYERTVDPVLNRTMVIADSFKYVKATPVSILKMFQSIVEGLISTADIIFFIFFAYGYINMLISLGAFYGALGTVIKKFNGKETLIFPIFMIIFGICGSTFGLYEETYGLLPAFMGISIALGYDALVGGAAVIVGTATGFAAATLNPFTIGIAQGIAEVPIGSGLGFRVIIFLVFQITAVAYVMLYARKVKLHPEKSIVKDVKFNLSNGMTREELEKLPFTGKHKLIMGLFLITIGVLVYGTTHFGWYLNELSTLFFVMMLVTGLIGGYNLSQISQHFITSASDVLFGAFAVGVARALTIVMEDGQIIDTIINYMSTILATLPKSIAAIGMIVVQNLINFFIPSGSGQAATSMPIMSSLSDAIGLTRQTAVLAFQFGDGFSNLFWPTSSATICGLMGLPINKWYRFITPLFLIMLVLQVIFIVIAVMINYGPF